MAATTLITLDVCKRDGSLSAISDDVPGLHVRAETAEAVRQKAIEAIKALYRFDKQMEVEVDPTDDLTVLRIRPLEPVSA